MLFLNTFCIHSQLVKKRCEKAAENESRIFTSKISVLLSNSGFFFFEVNSEVYTQPHVDFVLAMGRYMGSSPTAE